MRLQAGRELDALVAQKVFKHTVERSGGDPDSASVFGRLDYWNVVGSDMDWEKEFDNIGSLPRYSTNILHFEILLNHLAKLGVQIRLSNKAMGDQYWWAYLDGDDSNACAQGSTLLEALSLAAVELYSK
jgi:hypothetical protein